MTDPVSTSTGFFSVFSNTGDINAILMSYVNKASTMDQLEVMGILCVIMAITQIALCATLAFDNYAISRRNDRR